MRISGTSLISREDAFQKACTCHFRHFCRFRGSEERSPCFQRVECKFVIFAVFVKTAPFGLSAPHRCNANRSDAQRRFLATQVLSLFYSVIAVMAHPVLQHRHVNVLTSRASPFGLCFHLSFRHKWFPVQNNKNFTKSHNAAMSPLATRDGHRKRKTQTR